MLKNQPIIYGIIFVAVTVLIQLSARLLLWLSQFGQHPFDHLPIPVLVFLALLFSSILLQLKTRIPGVMFVWIFQAVIILNNYFAILFHNVLANYAYVVAPILAALFVQLLSMALPKYSKLIADICVYIAATLLANFTFDSFIPLPYFGLLNVGTLFFAITFTQRDRIHQYGKKFAIWAIFLAAISNVIVAMLIGTPLRYVIVGFTAIILSELADTQVYQRFINRSWLTRVAFSNAVSIPIDTIVFTVFAFYGEEFASFAWMSEVIITDIILKVVVASLVAFGFVGFSAKVLKNPINRIKGLDV